MKMLIRGKSDVQQLRRLLHDAVVLLARHTKLDAAHAERAAVDEVRVRQIRREPPVAEQRPHRRDRVFADKDDHVLPTLAPHVKVIRHVARRTDLAVAEAALLFIKAVCIVVEVLQKVQLACHGQRPPFCALSCLISRLSTNACTRVRSCPLPPVAFCRSTATDGIP